MDWSTIPCCWKELMRCLGSNIHRRNFFGMGEIIGVLTNVYSFFFISIDMLTTLEQPAEAVRSLTESRQLLEDARREIRENNERSQLRTKHTFSRLPGFLPRHAEMEAIERALDGEPSFTVLFGASSVGKACCTVESHPILSKPPFRPPFYGKCSLANSITCCTSTSVSQGSQTSPVCI